MYSDNIPDDVQRQCEKLSAAVKGYLTRRLFRTVKVQTIIKTVWDTVEFALRFQMESPVKKGHFSSHDRYLQERVLAQLNSALYEFHEIFFDVSTMDRMQYIAQDRAIELERRYKKKKEPACTKDENRRISAATLKSIERKKKALQNANEHSQTKMSTKSTTPNVEHTNGTSASGSQQSNHTTTGRVTRSARLGSSPRKPAKDSIHRLVVRDKSRAAGNATRAAVSSPVKPRLVSRPNKLPRRSSAATATALTAAAAASGSSATVITTRKVARPNTTSHVGGGGSEKSKRVSHTILQPAVDARHAGEREPSCSKLSLSNGITGENPSCMVRHVREVTALDIVSTSTSSSSVKPDVKHIGFRDAVSVVHAQNSGNLRTSALRPPEHHHGKQGASSKSG
jgi:hypothetical protein